MKDVDEDDDLVMVDAFSPEKPSRDRKGKSKVISDPMFKPPPAVPMPPGDYDLPSRRKRSATDSSANARNKQAKQDDDIVMVDAGGPSDNLGGLKRSDSVAKKAGLGGMLGGFLSKTRPDNKRRNTAVTDDEAPRGLRREDRKIKRPAKGRSEADDVDMTMSGGAAEEDQEARREARRARRAEKEAFEKATEEARKAKDEERRERRRRQEEEAEAKIREEKDARRAARREQRAKEDADRLAADAKEAERAERRKSRRAEREVQTDVEGLTEDPARLKKSDRRKSHMDGPVEDDEDRRRRREERHRMRSTDAPKTSRRKSAPVVDDYFDTRNGKPQARDEYLPADGPVYKNSKRKKAGWPHSGTDSWVQETSDAPPPPEDAAPAEGGSPVDDVADEDARRRLRRTRKHSKVDEADAMDERQRRRESRRSEKAATVRSGEGSQGDGLRSSRRDSGFVDTSRAPSASGGLFSRFKKIAGV